MSLSTQEIDLTPKQRKRGARQATIRVAAQRLFETRGYDRTSLKDIADELGITHPALYYYYKSKDALLFDVVSASMTGLLVGLKSVLADNEEASCKDRLKALAKEQILYQLDVKGATSLVDSVLYGPLSQMKLFEPEKEEILRTLQRELVALYVDQLDAGKLQGEFIVENTSVVAFSIIGSVSYVVYWYREGGHQTKEEVAEQVASYNVGALIQR